MLFSKMREWLLSDYGAAQMEPLDRFGFRNPTVDFERKVERKNDSNWTFGTPINRIGVCFNRYTGNFSIVNAKRYIVEMEEKSIIHKNL